MSFYPTVVPTGLCSCVRFACFYQTVVPTGLRCCVRFACFYQTVVPTLPNGRPYGTFLLYKITGIYPIAVHMMHSTMAT